MEYGSNVFVGNFQEVTVTYIAILIAVLKCCKNAF